MQNGNIPQPQPPAQPRHRPGIPEVPGAVSVYQDHLRPLAVFPHRPQHLRQSWQLSLLRRSRDHFISLPPQVRAQCLDPRRQTAGSGEVVSYIDYVFKSWKVFNVESGYKFFFGLRTSDFRLRKLSDLHFFFEKISSLSIKFSSSSDSSNAERISSF